MAGLLEETCGQECCDHEHHHHEHEECSPGHHHHEHHHHEHEECGHEHHHGHGEVLRGHDHSHEHLPARTGIFTSLGRGETAHKYTEEELDFMLKALSETEAYGTVLRSKGIIQMSDGSWRQFDLVPQEYEVREGQPDYTGRLCVIGTDLKKERNFWSLFHLK
ncbi:MAG: GTP-binding protein [[Clostridium] scindens]